MYGYNVRMLFPTTDPDSDATVSAYYGYFNISFYQPGSDMTSSKGIVGSIDSFRPAGQPSSPVVKSGGQNLPATARDLGCTVLYMIKDGTISSLPEYPTSFNCTIPTAVHGMREFQKHGTTYAVVNAAMTDAHRYFHDVDAEWKQDLFGTKRNYKMHILRCSGDFISSLYVIWYIMVVNVVYHVSAVRGAITCAGAR